MAGGLLSSLINNEERHYLPPTDTLAPCPFGYRAGVARPLHVTWNERERERRLNTRTAVRLSHKGGSGRQRHFTGLRLRMRESNTAEGPSAGRWGALKVQVARPGDALVPSLTRNFGPHVTMHLFTRPAAAPSAPPARGFRRTRIHTNVGAGEGTKKGKVGRLA